MSELTKDQPQTIAKSAFSFLSGTMVSRVSGLIRDMSMACFFGTSASIAAFFVALRFAILLRRILGEGALLNGFVPYFESHRKADPKQAVLFFRDVFFSISVFLIVLVVFVEILLYYLMGQVSVENKQILYLVMLILPGLPFICLFGVCSGLLHCEKYFFLTGVAPVAYNVIWIAAVWLFRHELPDNAAVRLSIAISIAFFFQWLITFPRTLGFTRQFASWKELLTIRLFSADVRAMFASLSLGVIGVAASQINSAIDTVFSRYACLEGPAYLNYALHLQQLPFALFGIGVSSALLPPLSRAFASDDTKQAHHFLEFAISHTLLIILPCTLAIFALGGVSVNLIYGRGDFSILAAIQTTYCLWGYGLGLTPMVMTLLLAPAFYAKKDYRTPMRTSLISIGVNLCLNALLVCVLGFGPASLAFSTSFTALLNAYLLYRSLAHKTGVIFSTDLFKSVGKTAICAAVAGALTFWVESVYGIDPFVRGLAQQCSQFLILFTVFSISFLGSAFILKRDEILPLIGKLKLMKLKE
jgi:putative peptidoglycan lipid II flippase